MRGKFFSRQGAAWLLVFSILLLFSCSGDGSGSNNQILWFSDIHFDPFADPDIVVELAEAEHADWGRIFSRSTIHGTYPSTGHETNYRLLRESLRDMRGHAPEPDIILFTGDFLAHHFNENYAALTGDDGQAGLRAFIDKTLAFLVDQILAHYPRTPVYFCLGNNDSYEGDYLLTRNSPFLVSSARILAPLLKSEADRAALSAAYLQGGQYELALPGANTRLLAMNSVFLSPHAPDESSGAAREQLEWLESRLGAADRDGVRVWILLHTPPGVDVFATRRSNPGAVSPALIVPLLREEHLARLRGIMLRYHEHVAAVFAGHIHRDDFRLFRTETGAAVATFVVPAISPVYADNPAYKILTYAPATLTIQDYVLHYLNPEAETWQTGQVFSRAYGPGELSPQRMDLLWADLRDIPGIRDQYASAYAAFRTPAEITDQNFPYYWNAIGVLDSASYRRAFLEQHSAPGAATFFVHGADRPLFWIADAWSGSPGPFQPDTWNIAWAFGRGAADHGQASPGARR